MGNVLVSWELGAGLGHIARLQPICSGLAARGHRLTLASPRPTEAQELAPGEGISHIGLPIRPPTRPIPHMIADGYIHILANAGFDDEVWLASAIRKWSSLLDDIRPDVVIADHSPSLLLALWGRDVPRINIGSGFFSPPPGLPLPRWTSLAQKCRDLEGMEARIAAGVNRTVTAIGWKEVPNLSALFHERVLTLLTTYPELDHFGQRTNVKYWGHWNLDAKTPPRWPDSEGPRVFAYLKPFPGMEMLLKSIASTGTGALVVCPGLDAGLAKTFERKGIRFEFAPLDIRAVASECDCAILNANHGTAAEVLLAGKPCLNLPLYLEQLLLAQRINQMEAGLTVLRQHPNRLSTSLHDLLSNPKYAAAARRFSARYLARRSGDQLPELLERIVAHFGS